MERLDINLVELTIPTDSPVIGQSLAELSMPFDMTISALVRAGRPIIPGGGTRLQAGDVLFVLAHREHNHLIRPIFEGQDPSEIM